MFSSILIGFHQKPSLKALVIEDDPYLPHALERVIRSLANREALIDIDWFTSALDGKKALERQVYDLVIADYCLSSAETGADVIVHAQGMPYSPYCLIMSGLPMSEINRRMKEHGIDVPILHKPFSISGMTQILEVKIREKISAKKAGCI